ncbi:MAG: GLUG motif-containing protein [Bacillota bacterium]
MRKIGFRFLTVVILLSMAAMPMATFAEDAHVCRVGETTYGSLDAAIAAISSGQTITLLSDITHTGSIVADTISMTVDLNGHDLSVSNAAGHALEARNDGTLNISDISQGTGVLTVSSSGAHKSAAHATSGGKISITGTLTASYPGGLDNQEIFAAYANGVGSSIDITGSATGYTAGVYANNGASITVLGDVSGSYYGAFAAYPGSVVNVTGDVASSSYGLTVEYGGQAVVNGNIQGNTAGVWSNGSGFTGTGATITGNIQGSATGIGASGDVSIAMSGSIQGASVSGISVSDGAEITLDGGITLSGTGVYMVVGLQTKGEDDAEDVTTKAGYLTYTDGTSTVWITPFAGGDGSAANPFLIETPQHLNNARYYLGSSHADKHFRLTGDIDLGVAPYNAGDGWVPIGTYDNPFTGSFDGDGYTIDGLFIHRSTDYVGLFGYAAGSAQLSNLNLVLDSAGVYGGSMSGVGALVGKSEGVITNSRVIGKVTGNGYVGGLVGKNNGAITDCYVTGEILSYGVEVGGLVGTNSGTITNCHASIAIEPGFGGMSYVGGLVGLNTGGTIIGSHAEGTVAGSYSVGGLVGQNDSGTVSASYATATTTGGGMVGGLVGYNRNLIENSYASGAATSSAERVGGLVGYNYGEINKSYAVGAVTGPISGGLVGETSSSTITASFYNSDTTGQDDTGKGVPKTTEELTQALTFSSAGWDFTDVWAIDEGLSYPYLKDNQQIPKPAPPESFAGGDGTADTPFLIGTPEHLNNVRNYLGSDHADKHFILTANIDLNVAPYNTGDGWEPIGTSSSAFTGSFDGNGYAISGLFIDRDTDYVGLFGCTSGADLTDISLGNVDVSGNIYVGGLAGDALGTTISDCHVTGDVVAAGGNVGGLVGRAYTNTSISDSSAVGTVTGAVSSAWYRIGGLAGDVDGASIQRSHAACTVSGDDSLGGLVGRLINGQISDSYATGSASGKYYVGGLIGSAEVSHISASFATGAVVGQNNYTGGLVAYLSNAQIENCYARGSVTGLDDYVGGLVGHVRGDASSVSYSYATGAVSNEGANTGGLVGSIAITGMVSAGYYDSQTTGQTDTGKGEPKTTAQMKLLTTYSGWDFPDTWTINGSDNGGYPALAWQGFDHSIPGGPTGGSGGGGGSSAPALEPEPEPEVSPPLEIRLTIGALQASVGAALYTLDAPAFIKSESNRTLVPIRFVGEALGARVEWLSQTRQVIIRETCEASQTEIVLMIGSDVARVNGEPVALDCPAELVPPGRTFIPLRFVSEILGATVDYDAVTKQVTMTR